MQIYFLGASRPAIPLTKTISPRGKDAYPLTKYFTSYEEEITSSLDLFNAIKTHAAQGHCMIKGSLSRPLVDEERRGATTTDDATQYICLDFDRHETDNINDDLARMGLGNINYVLQYSASHGLVENEGTLSAHVFMMLSAPVPAPTLKAWLMNINMTLFKDNLHLSRAKTTIRWPLDITTCQNDKLLYIAPPTFIDMKDPLKQRVQYIKRKQEHIDITTLPEIHINVLKNDERKILNELRKAEGLPARTAKTAWVNGTEVINKPDVCTVTGIKDNGEFVRLNLNGGDSWAYWHHKDNFELIHDFKADVWYRTKELVPGYYQDLATQLQAKSETPSEDGDLVLAFRDLRSAEYYNGLWNHKTQNLILHRAKNETQLDHWKRSHGQILGDYIPIWEIEFNPHEHWVLNADDHKINTFRLSQFMTLEPKTSPQSKFPEIMSVIKHMIGYKGPEDDKLLEHFINWFACIMQRKERPITAWVFHGNEGTGKGYFFNKIARQLIGLSNTISVTIGTIEDSFNGWQADKLLVFVDEVDVDDFKEKGRITAKLRNAITEPTVPIRYMRQQAIDMPNWGCYIFASNRPQPVFIPMSDRRYNVGNFQNDRLARPNDKKIAAELETFAQFLLAHKADIHQANSIIHTAARERIQKLGQTSIVETCTYVREGNFEELWAARPNERLLLQSSILNEQTQMAQAYNLLMRQYAEEIVNGATSYILTRDELMIIMQYNVGNLPRTPNKFTSMMRHNGIELQRLRRKGELITGIHVTWYINEEMRAELLKTLVPSKAPLKKVKG